MNKVLAKLLRVFGFLLASLLACRTQAGAVQSSAGASVTNVSTFSYADSIGDAFTGQSNTLTIYVQNAPTLTITSPAGKNVTVGDNVIDMFTLTNTGNGSGNFQVNADASNAGNATATPAGYVLQGATSGTCSTAAPCPLSTLQTQLAALAATATDSSITIGVVYIVTSTTYGQTLQYSIAPAISYPSGANTTAATSSTVTSTAFTDTIVVDARLDIEVSSTPPPGTGVPIAWEVTANNGGGYPARDLVSTKTLLGASANGVALFIQVPVYAGTALALSSQPATPTVSGDTVTMYYSTLTGGSPPSSSSSWSQTYASNATWIAIYLSGATGGTELASAPNGSSGAGVVTAAPPQISFTFSTAQPGSSTTNIVKLVVNGAIGGNPWDTGTIPVIAPGIASGTADGATSLTPVESNAVSGSGTGAWPGGASNPAGNQGYGMSLVTGPVKNADAAGSYPALPNRGSAAATNNDDFTALGFICQNGSGAFGGGPNCTVPPDIQIPNTVQNLGNLSDSITIAVTGLPSGWTAQIFTTSCSTSGVTAVSAGCGNLVSVSTAGANTTSSPLPLAAGATQDYVVQYNNNSGVTPYVAVDALITATGSTADSNSTHNDLYPGGVIEIVTTATTSNCPIGGSSTTVCPGGLIQYVTTYTNVAPLPSVGVGTNHGTEPSFAYGAMVVGTALTITSDGSGGGWAMNTFGLDGAGVSGSSSAIPAASDPGNTQITAYMGCPDSCTQSTAWASGTYATGGTGITAGPNKLTATVLSTSPTVLPGGSGTITYYVTVR